MIDLKGKNIIVTGASGGIGNSIIKKLYQNEANILASGTRLEKLDELKDKFENIKTLKFDISQSDKIDEFVENATKELDGNLDCIINNAGVTQDNLAIRMSLEEWQKVININLTSTFLMSKSAIEILKRKRHNIYGPFPADTIFLKNNRDQFDVILGMYHDQVLTPVKTIFEYDAINITLGLPFVRISPDHGPNEKMMGKNISNPLSLMKAISFLEKY